jgi:AcrR family transcriptional regulator
VSEDLAVEPSSRERAVSRAVGPARERAEMKVKAFLDAAHELLAERGDFTLQMVVERSGQSLRSFYQHFAGKHELLLALYEESIEASAVQLTDELRVVPDPLERLRTFVVEYHRLCLQGTARYAENPLQSRAMAQFAHQLLIYHPTEVTQAFTPLVAMLNDLLDDARGAGAIRDDLDGETAGFVLQSIMFSAFVPTIAGTTVSDDPSVAAQKLWERLLDGFSKAPA